MLLINKPSGPTSHDIIDKIRRIMGEERVGHTGTLDPFAKGLLIVLVGRKETRKQTEFLNMDKVYEATIVLSEERITDDITGDVRHVKSKIRNQKLNLQSKIQKLPKITIIKVLKSFEGEQMQMPPDYSAKKVKGRRAYELARKGEKIKLKPKKIKVFYIKLLGYKWPEVKIEVKVSSGTYIRALARDIGRVLGVGAYLSELKRTQIGKYKLKNAKTIEELKKSVEYQRT